MGGIGGLLPWGLRPPWRWALDINVFMALSAMTLPGAKFAEFGKVIR